MPSARPLSSIPVRAWGVLALAGSSGMLIYLDRQTLSVLKTTLKGALLWSDTHYGWLVATFMVCYTAGYFITGPLIDRWGTRVMMPIFIGAMSLSTVLTGFASQLWEFAACRAVLGLAAGGLVPSVLVSIIAWFPHDRRGTASMLNKPLPAAGNILVTPLAVWITSTIDWRWAFMVPGFVGLLVALLWWFADHHPPSYGAPAAPAAPTSAAPTPNTAVTYPTSSTAATAAPPRTGYAAVLRNRTLWGLVLARAISDPLWFFLMFWQPGYLQEILAMPLERMGQIGWIPFAVSLVFNMGFSWLSDRLIHLGWAPAVSRTRLLQALACLSPFVLLLPFITSHGWVIVLLCVVQTMAVSWFNLSNLLMADLMPRQQVATAVGISNACGAATGALVNFFAGALVAQFGYGTLFFVGALLHPTGALILWWFYQRNRR